METKIAQLPFEKLQEMKENFHNFFAHPSSSEDEIMSYSYTEGQKIWDEIIPETGGTIMSEVKYYYELRKK